MRALLLILLAALPMGAFAEAPQIHKRGTMECDMVEVTPIVWQGRLYRFEYVRDSYKHNPQKTSCFRFVDLSTGGATEPFAPGYHLGCAFVEHDKMYAYGVKEWGGSAIEVFWSTDLKSWQQQTALEVPGAKIFNTSVCKGPKGFTMAIEFGEPAEWVGNGFTNLFAQSADLLKWTMLPPQCVYTKERYSACPALRFLDGFYYMVYLEAYPEANYMPHIVRSRDLKEWESSPFKPMMRPGAEDKRVANSRLTVEERARIGEAADLNNSDLDFCEFNGKTVICYSWGNQHGNEFLAEAYYEGTESQFLKAWFPGP